MSGIGREKDEPIYPLLVIPTDDAGNEGRDYLFPASFKRR